MKIICNSNFSVHKVYIYWGTTTLVCFCIVYGFFHAATVELSSHNKNPITYKVLSIYSLVLCRKSLPNPAPIHFFLALLLVSDSNFLTKRLLLCPNSFPCFYPHRFVVFLKGEPDFVTALLQTT